MQNILVLTYFSFREPLTQSYVLPYLSRIPRMAAGKRKLFLVTLEKKEYLTHDATVASQQLASQGIHWIPFRYFSFGLTALLQWSWILPRLVFLLIRERIRWIHCWATPSGAAGVMLKMLTGRKLIVDSFEPHAEAMIENGTWKRSGLAFRMLFFLERLQARHADILIGTTAGMKQYAREKYGVDPKYFHVKPACVDMDMFALEGHPVPSMNLSRMEKKIVCVYAGKIGGIYLDKELFDFVAEAHRFWEGRFHFLLLTHVSPGTVQAIFRQSTVDEDAVTIVAADHFEVPSYLALADFAITPVKPVPSKRYCSPIKNGEYWAMGLPVIITSDISDDSRIIKEEGAGVVLEELSKDAYKKALAEMDKILQEPREQVRKKIRALAERYRNYRIAEAIYNEIYDPY